MSSGNSSEYKDRFFVANRATELELRCRNNVIQFKIYKNTSTTFYKTTAM